MKKKQNKDIKIKIKKNIGNTKDKDNVNLEEKLKQLEGLSKKHLENWKQAEANFLNYKKEESVRIKEHIEYQQQKILLEFLNILDNILLAEDHIPKDLKENIWVLGIIQIKGQMIKLLENYSMKKIRSLGQMVDFKFHEVLQEVETSNKKSGIIIAVAQEGYIMNEKVIRPAKVIIAK